MFQSTLPRGERHAGHRHPGCSRQGFNPRSHAGSDSEEFGAGHESVIVSIHAPTRGATCILDAVDDFPPMFQSTLPRGERLFERHLTPTVKFGFQSTLPRGERRLSLCIRTLNRRFNPRSHAGSDPSRLYQNPNLPNVSIHAPTRGATPVARGGYSRQQSFNPRSHAGSDKSPKEVSVEGLVSIHAPTRGATSGSTVRNLRLTFQSTLPRGERHSDKLGKVTVVIVSIHAPTRGATDNRYFFSHIH